MELVIRRVEALIEDLRPPDLLVLTFSVGPMLGGTRWDASACQLTAKGREKRGSAWMKSGISLQSQSFLI